MMSIIIKYYIILVTSILQIHNINSSETLSTFTTLPKPLLPPNESLSPSPSPSPSNSPHHHHPRRHRRHKQQPSLAPQPTKHGLHHLFSAPSPSPDTLVVPANSSLNPPRKTSSKSSTKRIVIIISIALFSVAVIAYASVLLIQHRRRHLQQDPVRKMEKSDSVRLYPPNAPASDTTSLSFNSPELRPLPPLPKQNLIGQQTYYNSTYEGNYHEVHDEEFFSPLGVSGSPNADVSSSSSVTGAENLRSHSLKSEITSSRSASASQTMSRCPSVASTSTSRTLTQESCVNFSIPQRNAGQVISSNPDEIESVDFALNPPLLPPPRLRKLWFKSEGTGNVSPEPGIPAKTLPPNPPLTPPPRLRKLWFESEGTSNVLPELEIPAKPLPPNPPLMPPPRLRKTWLESESTSNVWPDTERQKNKGGETSERIL